MARRGRRTEAVAAVAVFLLCDVIGSALGLECDKWGCCYNSGRTQATCNFTTTAIDLLLRGLPKLEHAKITQGNKVSLKEDVVANITELRSLLFSDIQELILESNSKVQVKADRAVSLTVRQVGVLRLETSAFLGWQSALATVSIGDTENVIIEQDAFPAGSSFQRIRLFNITSLTLETGAIHGKVGQLELENIRSLQLMPNAIRGTVETLRLSFLGWQSAIPTISFGDMQSVHIDQDTFPASSSFQRIRLFNITSLTLETEAIRGTVGQLELENIHSLQLVPSAIRGTVETLSLRNVSATSCPPLAIGGSIDFVSLHSVTLTDLESRCLDAGRGWQRLTLTDCRLGHMSPHSIHGSIANVTICGCQIARVGTAAVSVNVIRLNMSTTTVGELGPMALQVNAISSITLHQVSVTHLRQNALSGLKINDTTTTGGSGGGVSVSRLSVDHAEPGSLRFAEGAPVMLQDLLLPGGCVCRSPSWAHQLLLGPSSSDEDGTSSDEGGPSPDSEDSPSSDDRDGVSSGDGLATERDTLLRQVEDALCTVSGVNISLSDFTAQHCGGAGGVSGQTQPDGRSAPLAGWWSYLGVAALAALLLAAAVLLVIAVARCRRQRQRKWPERPEPAGAAGEGLCSAGGPAVVGGQPGSSHYCRLVQPSGPTHPQVLYSDVSNRLSDADQRTDRSPPAGGSQSEPLYVNSPKAKQCSCTSAELCAISAQTDECTCKPARLSDDEPVYANMPGGERKADPVYTNTPGGERKAEPVYTNTPGGERKAEPVYTNTPGGERKAEPVYTNTPGGERKAEPVYTNTPGGERNAEPVYVNTSGGERRTEPVYANTPGDERNAEPVYTNTPGDERKAEPVYTNTLGGERKAEPVYTNTPGGERNAEPVYTNTPGGERNAEPVYANTPGGERKAEPVYVNTPGGERNAEPVYTNTPGGERKAEPVYNNTPGGERNAEPVYVNTPGGERNAEPAHAVGSQTAGAADTPRHLITQEDRARAGAKPPDQTGDTSDECSEDLPDYAEISPEQCPEDLPEYAEISPAQCPEDLPDYAEISPAQCPEDLPDYAEISPRSPANPSPADPTGRHINSIPIMVENELYGSVV